MSVSTEDNQKLDQSLDYELLGQDLGRESTAPVDFNFLKAQTFGDTDLEHELLALFVGQVRRILPGLGDLPPKAQADAVHLLKGSARGIGAWRAARAAAAYETAPPAEQASAGSALASEFAAATAAIESILR